MNKVIVDTSVWIDYFRKDRGKFADEMSHLLDNDRVALTGIIELEILQGLRHKEAEFVKPLLQSLHYIDTERKDFIEAGLKLYELRQKGVTIPPSDCLIATQCKHNDMPIFTLDSDFDHFRDIEHYRPHK